MPKTGHTFAGFTSTAFTGTKQPGDTFSMPAADVVLVAQWTVNSYNYVITLDGGTGGSGGTAAGNINYGATVTLRTTPPTKTGHTFASWSVNNGIGSKLTGETFLMPAANTTATAVWTVNNYNYYIDLNGGVGGSGGSNAGSFSYGATITMRTTAPTKTGSTFSGWKRSDTGVILATGATTTMPASNLTVTAQWDVSTFTVTYDANGGTGAPAPHTGVAYGATVTIKAYS